MWTRNELDGEKSVVVKGCRFGSRQGGGALPSVIVLLSPSEWAAVERDELHCHCTGKLWLQRPRYLSV